MSSADAPGELNDSNQLCHCQADFGNGKHLRVFEFGAALARRLNLASVSDVESSFSTLIFRLYMNLYSHSYKNEMGE